MIRRERLFVSLSFAAVAGVALLFGAVTWYVWQQSLTTEEERVELLARTLGQRVEDTILHARDILNNLNEHGGERCSDAHLSAMDVAAITQAHIRAIGYWEAAERVCGVGFTRGTELTPPNADRIYESGVIAWWPDEQTELAGVQFFLMRYGAHDVVIDPRELLDSSLIEHGKAGLWVEGLRMAASPWDAELPSPHSLSRGLTVDHEHGRVISRFSLGAIFPIDVVAVEPLGSFWERYLPMIALAGLLGLMLVAAWIYLIYLWSRRQLSLGAELREAITAGHLKVLYQPVVDLGSRQCIGAEALVRWEHEDGSLITPDVFIPIAERNRLISDVTGVVLNSIIEELGDMIRKHPEIRINLNLSRQDIESPEFFSILSDTLREKSIPAPAIKLEITERALINSDTAREMIRKLRTSGHQVAIDDFGTGYSSLSYLESFEIDTLKIDKSFVDAVEKEAVTSHVITHVIDMAHSLQLDTVAEGVEEEHQVKWLYHQGVTHGQGFLFSKPLTGQQFARFYRRHGAEST